MVYEVYSAYNWIRFTLFYKGWLDSSERSERSFFWMYVVESPGDLTRPFRFCEPYV